MDEFEKILLYHSEQMDKAAGVASTTQGANYWWGKRDAFLDAAKLYTDYRKDQADHGK